MTEKASLLPATRSPDPSDTPRDQARPLTDHLEELRVRLIKTLLAAAVFSVAAYFFSDAVIRQLARTAGPLVFLKPAEALMAKLKVSCLLGLFASAPVALYQAWRFVGVALTVSERRVALGALPFSYLLFAAGAALAWFGIVPVGLKVLTAFGSEHVRALLSVEAVLEFALWVTLGLGLLFQIPVVLAALAHWGLVRSATLGRYRRHAALAILVLSAVLTPGPDVASQLLLAVPTYLLFEISLVVCRFLE